MTIKLTGVVPDAVIPRLLSGEVAKPHRLCLDIEGRPSGDDVLVG